MYVMKKSNTVSDIDDIKSKITSNTKAIVVINPNNPTGSLYPKDVLEQIVDIARQNGFDYLCGLVYDQQLWMVRNILQSLVLHQMSSACL